MSKKIFIILGVIATAVMAYSYSSGKKSVYYNASKVLSSKKKSSVGESQKFQPGNPSLPMPDKLNW